MLGCLLSSQVEAILQRREVMMIMIIVMMMIIAMMSHVSSGSEEAEDGNGSLRRKRITRHVRHEVCTLGHPLQTLPWLGQDHEL